jgi:hypothetical protein
MRKFNIAALFFFMIAITSLSAVDENKKLAKYAAKSNFITFAYKKSSAKKYGEEYELDAKKVFSHRGQTFYCYVNDKYIFNVTIKGQCYDENDKKLDIELQIDSYNVSGTAWEHYLDVFKEAPGLYTHSPGGGRYVTYTFEFEAVKPRGRDVEISVFSGESPNGDEIDTIETDSYFTKVQQKGFPKDGIKVSRNKVSFTKGSNKPGWAVNTILKKGKGVIKYTYSHGGKNMICFMVPAIPFKSNVKIPRR